jgi:hypothetical protein
MRLFTLVTLASAASMSFAALGACASDNEGGASVPDASVDRAVAAPQPAPDAATSQPDAADASSAMDAALDVDAAPVEAGACNVRIDAFPILDSPHVADGTVVAYNSNPPSSGPHYNTWVNFQEITHPVEDGNLVHSLEHGAVLLLYKCTGAECDAIVPALRAVRDAVATDPICDPAIRTRVILAPRAGNDVAVAAAAWGHVYRADCVDAASLASFIAAHYGQGPENLCVQGQVF